MLTLKNSLNIYMINIQIMIKLKVYLILLNQNQIYQLNYYLNIIQDYILSNQIFIEI